jgi:hypothetical protein
MTENLPQWTSEITDNFVVGEDHLGVEGAAQSYQQFLIPGVITTTDRARYYSFYAWVLYRFINSPDSSRLLKDFRGQFYKRHEVALILASYSHHKDREVIGGLVGSGVNNYKVRSWWEGGDPVSLDVNYFNNSLGGFGQYYYTAMRVMGIVADSEHPRWVYRLTRRGEQLAEAYQNSIANTNYFQTLEKSGELVTLTHDSAIELGRVGCICPEALEIGEDRELLRDALLRLQDDNPQDYHIRRRLALAVVMDLVRNAKGKFQRDMIRPALYLYEYGPGMEYRPSIEIRDWAQRWKLVEVRHLYTFGLQSLWAAFLLNLSQRDHGLSLPDFMSWVKSQLSEGIFDLSMSDYLDGICREIGLPADWLDASPVFDLTCRQNTGRDEYSLFLKAARNYADPQQLLKYGVQILGQLFMRFLPLHYQEDSIWLEMANRERLPFTMFFATTENYAKQADCTVGDWITSLYREFILGQHEFIALEKLRYQGYDTFKFSYQDGQFYWPFSTPDAYREPIRLAANRLFNALTILTDLGLVLKDENGNHFLGRDGEFYFERCLEAHYDGA